MWFYPDLCLKPLLESGFKTLRFRCPDSLVSCRKADSCKKSMRFQKYPDSSGRCLNICLTTISFLCIMFGFTIHTNTLLRFPIANYQLAMIYWNCSKNSIQVNRRLFSGCCPLFHFKIQFSKYPISVVYTNSPKPSDTKTKIYSGELFKKDAVSVTAFTGFVWTEGRFMFKKIYPLSK